MSDTIERATADYASVEELVRQRLSEAFGGVRGIAEAAVPTIAFTTPATERTLQQQRHVAESDALIEELRRADVLVLGVPTLRGVIENTFVRAAGPKLDAGDERELDAMLAELSDILPARAA